MDLLSSLITGYLGSLRQLLHQLDPLLEYLTVTDNNQVYKC